MSGKCEDEAPKGHLKQPAQQLTKRNLEKLLTLNARRLKKMSFFTLCGHPWQMFHTPEYVCSDRKSKIFQSKFMRLLAEIRRITLRSHTAFPNLTTPADLILNSWKIEEVKSPENYLSQRLQP